eukprot:gene7188-12858_t
MRSLNYVNVQLVFEQCPLYDQAILVVYNCQKLRVDIEHIAAKDGFEGDANDLVDVTIEEKSKNIVVIDDELSVQEQKDSSEDSMKDQQLVILDSDSEEASANTEESEAPEVVSNLTFIHSSKKKRGKLGKQIPAEGTRKEDNDGAVAMKHDDEEKFVSNEVMTPDSTSKELKSPARNTPNLNVTLKEAREMLGTRSLGRTRSQDRKRTLKRASSSPKATPKSGKNSFVERCHRKAPRDGSKEWFKRTVTEEVAEIDS